MHAMDYVAVEVGRLASGDASGLTGLAAYLRLRLPGGRLASAPGLEGADAAALEALEGASVTLPVLLDHCDECGGYGPDCECHATEGDADAA